MISQPKNKSLSRSESCIIQIKNHRAGVVSDGRLWGRCFCFHARHACGQLIINVSVAESARVRAAPPFLPIVHLVIYMSVL